jgi:cation transport regulator ChaB
MKNSYFCSTNPIKMKLFQQGSIIIAAAIFLSFNVYAKKDKKKKEDTTASVKTMTDSIKTAVKDSTKKESKPAI